VNHLELGAEGESLATDYLARRGWRILGRNIQIGGGELDIVAMDGDELVVVEVRTRSIGHILPPEMTVGPQKIRKIARAARSYVRKISYNGNWRIDVVAITVNEREERIIELFSDVTMGMEGGFMG
jgi:putative endonuclease